MDATRADQIAAFLAVVEARSFTAAARALDRDASVLSRRVAALEARLGVRLLERSTRRVVPSEAGARLAERLREVAIATEEAEAEAVQAGGAARGRLRLSLPAAFGRLWVAPLLPGFLAAHPDIRIEAEFGDRYADLVAEGFDAAIRIGDLQDSRLVAIRLAENRRLLCAAPAYLAARGSPAAPEDLARHACLGFTGMREFPEWRFRRGERAVSVRIGGPLTADDAQSLVVATLAGAGLMIGSDWLVAPPLATGRLVSVLPEWRLEGGGGIHLVRPSARHPPGKTRAFVDWMVARLKPPPWLGG